MSFCLVKRKKKKTIVKHKNLKKKEGVVCRRKKSSPNLLNLTPYCATQRRSPLPLHPPPYCTHRRAPLAHCCCCCYCCCLFFFMSSYLPLYVVWFCHRLCIVCVGGFEHMYLVLLLATYSFSSALWLNWLIPLFF